MKLTLQIDADGAAFHEHDDDDASGEPCLSARSEMGRLLASIAGSVHAGQRTGSVRDLNGNTCGFWALQRA